MNDGSMESYFHLADQYVTQVDPATCGPSSLAMTLNALEIDPRTPWKG
jgi:glutathione gamma-glutamylcysteinyltransferase